MIFGGGWHCVLLYGCPGVVVSLFVCVSAPLLVDDLGTEQVDMMAGSFFLNP